MSKLIRLIHDSIYGTIMDEIITNDRTYTEMIALLREHGGVATIDSAARTPLLKNLSSRLVSKRKSEKKTVKTIVNEFNKKNLKYKQKNSSRNSSNETLL